MGIDLETLIILAVLAFILFGPEKLPEYAAMLGKFVAKMRQASTEMTRQYQDQNPFHYPPEPTLPPAPESTCPTATKPCPRVSSFAPNAATGLRKIIFRRRPSRRRRYTRPSRLQHLNRSRWPIPGFGHSTTRKLIGPWRSSTRPPWLIKG